jgi:hypothetical protein
MSVLTLLTTKSSSLVLSTKEKVGILISISTLQKRLNDYFGTDVKGQLKFGSSTRDTILPRSADWNSDIDYMVIFDNSSNFKPTTYIDKLKRFANAKYSTSEIAQSHPTVVLKLNHIMFDLVPAYKDFWGSTYIPAPTSSWSDWMTTDPNGFNSKLAKVNQFNSNLVKPTIRLMKYWNAQNGHIFDSYSLEQYIADNYYWNCNNLKDYFFKTIEGLSTNGLSLFNASKVKRAKDIIIKVKQYEQKSMPVSAEVEIKKLIP